MVGQGHLLEEAPRLVEAAGREGLPTDGGLDLFQLLLLELAHEVGAHGRALVEASGSVSLDTVADIARTGVDIISVGALTHSVRSLDLGLDIELRDIELRDILVSAP